MRHRVVRRRSHRTVLIQVLMTRMIPVHIHIIIGIIIHTTAIYIVTKVGAARTHSYVGIDCRVVVVSRMWTTRGKNTGVTTNRASITGRTTNVGCSVRVRACVGMLRQ